MQVIPDLCEFIQSEIIASGETEFEKIPGAAGIAAGALGRLSKAELPIGIDLLRLLSNALWRFGLP